MDEFEKARERAERRRARLGITEEITEVQEAVTATVVKLPEPKPPKKRSNEINVSVWINGDEYCFSYKTNLTGTLMGSQQNKAGVHRMILEALRGQFGNVEMM